MKDYNKLILVDLLCASTESPKIWEKYLKENFADNEIKNITFRDKQSFGWTLQLNIYFENGNYYIKEVILKTSIADFFLRI